MLLWLTCNTLFHCFRVKKEHRNFLRSLWYNDNKIRNRLTEYRVKVHVFRNSPSPAIATFGLKKIAEMSEESHGSYVGEFIRRNLYVDVMPN